MQISAAISLGSSGSPVLNARGEVVGVATALVRDGQSLNFAVPVNAVRELLNDPRTTAALSPNPKIRQRVWQLLLEGDKVHVVLDDGRRGDSVGDYIMGHTTVRVSREELQEYDHWSSVLRGRPSRPGPMGLVRDIAVGVASGAVHIGVCACQVVRAIAPGEAWREAGYFTGRDLATWRQAVLVPSLEAGVDTGRGVVVGIAEWSAPAILSAGCAYIVLFGLRRMQRRRAANARSEPRA